MFIFLYFLHFIEFDKNPDSHIGNACDKARKHSGFFLMQHNCQVLSRQNVSMYLNGLPLGMMLTTMKLFFNPNNSLFVG